MFVRILMQIRILSGQPVRDFAVGVRFLFYDAARKRLYLSGGDGYIDVFQNQEDNRLARVAHLSTAAGARTSLFVPDQGRLYLAVPHRGSQKAEIRVYEAR